MSQSVLDGSTVPIFYEKRKIEILIDKLIKIQIKLYNKRGEHYEN